MVIRHYKDEQLFAALDDDGVRIGEIKYEPDGEDFRAVETHVFKGHEGQGIAGRLLDGLVAWAKDRGAKIVPVCKYVKATFEKFPEKYASVAKPAPAETGEKK